MPPSVPGDARIDEVAFRSAEAADRAAVEALLRTCGLSLDAGPAALAGCLLAEAGDRVVGVAAMELHGELGLLHCVAVRPEWRGLGVGKQLATAAEAFARAQGVRELCVLTAGSLAFLGGRGYRVDNRADAPAAIQASPAFQAAGRDTAVFMTLTLAAKRPPSASIRQAELEDAAAILDIYTPIVRYTSGSFELEPPSIDEMRARIACTLAELPWLVSIDDHGTINGFAHASLHRDRPACRWSVEITVNVRQGCREQGVGRRLCEALLRDLVQLGYCQALSRIALPNEAAVALHQALGFEPQGVFRKVGYKNGTWLDVGWWQRQLRELPLRPEEPGRRPTPAAAEDSLPDGGRATTVS